MNPEEIYQSWKRQLGRGDAPPGFADKVMRVVAAHQRRSEQRWWARWYLILAASRLGRAAILALALLLFAGRLLAVAGVFLVNVWGPAE